MNSSTQRERDKALPQVRKRRRQYRLKLNWMFSYYTHRDDFNRKAVRLRIAELEVPHYSRNRRTVGEV